MKQTSELIKTAALPLLVSCYFNFFISEHYVERPSLSQFALSRNQVNIFFFFFKNFYMKFLKSINNKQFCYMYLSINIKVLNVFKLHTIWRSNYLVRIMLKKKFPIPNLLPSTQEVLDIYSLFHNLLSLFIVQFQNNVYYESG